MKHSDRSGRKRPAPFRRPPCDQMVAPDRRPPETPLDLADWVAIAIVADLVEDGDLVATQPWNAKAESGAIELEKVVDVFDEIEESALDVGEADFD